MLPQLTFLQLGEVVDHITAETAPGFSTLTAPQYLQLQFASPCDYDWGDHFDQLSLQPSLLAGMTKLQFLEIVDAALVGEAAGVADLFVVLRGMQQLTTLYLSHILDMTGCPAEAYSALTASSNLQRLRLRCCGLQDDPTVWQHVFPASTPPQKLRTLDLTFQGWEVDARQLKAADVACIAASCPALQELNLTNVRGCSRGAQQQPLHQLQALTRSVSAGLVTTLRPNTWLQ